MIIIILMKKQWQQESSRQYPNTAKCFGDIQDQVNFIGSSIEFTMEIISHKT